MKQEDLEQIFIGSILRNPSAITTTQDVVKDLKTELAIGAFRAGESLLNSKKPVNLESVTMAAGWQKYAGWLSMAEDIGTGSNVFLYAKEIQIRAAKGRIKDIAKRIITRIDTDHLDLTMDTIRNLYSGELTKGEESGTIHEAMQEFEEQSAKYKAAGNIGIETGFTKWDQEMITYEPGHLWALGGFTSVGKTATALELIGRIGNCEGVAIFSMEMTKPQIVSRMLARITGYSSKAILAGRINDTALFRAKEYLASRPLHIFRKTRDWAAVANACRVLKMQGEISIAVFDYQQNIGAEGKSTHDKMEAISRGAQDLVQDIEITGIMLSQISLQQSRDDSGNPEFKGGGGLAECADVAIHLSRVKGSETDMLVEMRKNRHGPKIDLALQYQSNFTRLEEIG
jgi:replicative DNA helicase